MKPLAPPIGLADTPAGILVSLPPRLWLAVSLRKSFRGVIAAAEPWTYLVPRQRGARLGEWIAEVELQVLAERRARAWTASEAEWSGAVMPPIAAAAAAEPVIVRLPKRRTAREVLALLQAMAAGEVLAVESGHYRLSPSGRRIRASVAARAIGQRLIVPSCDGLFGPDWSQTWRSPTKEELRAAAEPGGTDRPQKLRGRKADRGRPDVGAQAFRPPRRARPRIEREVAPDAGGRAPARHGRPGLAAKGKPACRGKRSAGA